MLLDNLLLLSESVGTAPELQAPASPDEVILCGEHLVGVKVLGTPVTIMTKTGFLAPKITELLFDQIHFFPQLVYNLGILFSNTEQDTYIWNTFAVAKTLNSVVATTLNGVSNDYVPGSIDAFDVLEGTILLSSSGSSAVDGYYTFATTVRDIIVYINFTRALSLPFLPMDMDDFNISYTFNTVIESTKYQKEQRRPLFLEPQRDISFTLLETESNKLKAKNIIKIGQAMSFVIPLYMELMELISSAANVIQVSTDFTNFWNINNYCNSLFVYDCVSGDLYTYEVTSVNSIVGTITVAYPILDTISSSCIAFPSVMATMNSPTISHKTDAAAVFNLSFTEIIWEGMASLVTPTDPATHLSLAPNWEVEPSVKFDLLRELISYPGTVTTMYSITARTREIVSYGYRIELPDIMFLMNFICWNMGRLKAFYYKEHTPLFYVVNTILAGDADIVVEDSKFDLVWFSGFEIVIVAKGVTYEREITAVSIGTWGTQTISLSSAVGVELLPSEIIIYAKRKVRFNKDIFEFNYPTLSWADVELEFLELIQEV